MPYIVIAKGILSAILTDGKYKGLPLGLACEIVHGRISFEEVQTRGWKLA